MELFLGLVFGAVGSGYLVYAKRQQSAMFLIFGVALILFPYFVSGIVATVTIGAIIAAVPLLVARGILA